MKKIILTLFFIISIFSFGAKYKMIISDNASGKLDINKATREEMLRSGVAESYVSKIISFRDIKGGIENINELESVSGIGEKTCEKLKKYFFINEIPNIKPLYINKADDKILSYYGFNKKEIKNIRKFLEKNKKIKNNIILKKVISQNKYEKYKDIIRYDVY
ncbi:ComEA family DNA-binding protein [Fusobacterium perfoetens]|uniref:ComEA family DNA-binding protein n=1 Tax=Fusobacterium perfoetens TaxID=852 RepID=UPI001F1F2523|nr:helix-hairpin-helix domain-containing protein [Fusobacterium perfoetens]